MADVIRLDKYRRTERTFAKCPPTKLARVFGDALEISEFFESMKQIRIPVACMVCAASIAVCFYLAHMPVGTVIFGMGAFEAFQWAFLRTLLTYDSWENNRRDGGGPYAA